MKLIFQFLMITLVFALNLPKSWGDMQFHAVLISDQRIDELRKNVKNQIEPTFTAYQEIKAIADNNLNRQASVPKHWYIPGYYRDAKGHAESKAVLQNDANIAYQMALVYRMTGDETYAKTVTRLAHSWATEIETMSQEDDSTLSFSYHFPALIFAADLIRESNHWTKKHEQDFQSFLRDKALPMNTMNRDNNWGNWGLVLVMAIATYLEEEALFEQGIERWKTFIETQIDENGHMPHEVHRSGGQRGIWYTHFALFPQTIAAEIARVNGVDVFAYESPRGRTLKMAYEVVAQWADDTETFPYLEDPSKELRGIDYVSYFEILYPRWPNPHAKNLLLRLRPMSARHSAPALTLTHGTKLN